MSLIPRAGSEVSDRSVETDAATKGGSNECGRASAQASRLRRRDERLGQGRFGGPLPLARGGGGGGGPAVPPANPAVTFDIYNRGDGRARDDASQERPRRDAQGRGDHG